MIKTIDFAILDFLQEFLRNPILDNIFCVITWLGNSGMIWICCGMIFLFFKKTRIMGISLLISLTIGFLIGEVWIKPMIGRTRPFYYHEMIELAIAAPESFSFPSGHSWSSFAGAVSIWLYHRRMGIVALILAVCIAFSRIYLYVHFPTDVLVGSICGVITAILVHFVIQWIIRKNKLRMEKQSYGN